MQASLEQKYNLDVVRWFTDHGRCLPGGGRVRRGLHRIRTGLAVPEFRYPLYLLRTPASGAHERRHLRLWRLYLDGHRVLYRATHLRRAAVERQDGLLHLLGLERGHRPGRDHAPARADAVQGIRRAGMADRHFDRGRVALLHHQFHHDHRDPQVLAYLCVELVLPRHDGDDRLFARREQPGDSGGSVQVLLHLLWSPGRHDPVVVGTQRGRVLPDRRVSRHHVLFRS